MHEWEVLTTPIASQLLFSGDMSCLMCLPVGSMKRSSAGAPDFTTILVCHNNGPVRWYTLVCILYKNH